MAAFEQIASTTLVSAQTQVTFGSIPQTYQHLVLRILARNTGLSSGAPSKIYFNGDTSSSDSNYLVNYLERSGAGVTSGLSGNYWGQQTCGSAIANMYTHWELQIPAYTNNSLYKQGWWTNYYGIQNASPQNQWYNDFGGWLYNKNNTAISSIQIVPFNDADPTWTAGSRFYLYGIKTSNAQEKIMAKPTKLEYNCETGEERIVELTDAEIAQMEKDIKATAERIAKEEAEAKAKAEIKASALAKLAALGLSEEEAAAIVGA